MKSPRPLLTAAAICCLLLAPPRFAPAQTDPTATGEDPDLTAAVRSRRDSAEFKQCLEALNAAQQAREAAISAIPQIRAIDEELERLDARTRELHILRQEVLDYYASTLAPYRTDEASAREALLAADPVRELLDTRTTEIPTDPGTATR